MKKFRRYEPDQLSLLPPAIDDWLPKGHLAYFVSDLVDTLDLGAVYASYAEDKGGQPPYNPHMMVKLLCYGYCIGVRSSRKIEQATWEDIPFRVLSTDQHPDHDTISAFRERHLKALSGIFEQILHVAIKAQLVDLYHVAVDGSKVKANAGRTKSLSMDKVTRREEKLKKVVEDMLNDAARIDEEENEKYGDRSSYLLPDEYKDHEYRLKRIQELKRQMEEEQREVEEARAKEAEAKEAKKKKRTAKATTTSKKKAASSKNKDGEKADKESEKPKKEKGFTRNLTDYDSRLMRMAGGNWGQCYNGQIVVDGKKQIIVAGDVTNQVNDKQQLVPMLSQVEQQTGQKPKFATADSGYFSNENVKAKDLEGIDLVVATDKRKRTYKRGKRAFTAKDEMQAKLEKPEYAEIYKKRKSTVEPVFGQMKDSVLKFGSFTFRGIEKVTDEWMFLCAIHNLMKLFRSSWKPA